MFQLDRIQDALDNFGFDGWLLYDFRGSNVLARRILDLDGKHVGSRRFAYWIPKSGTPKRLVHRIEDKALDDLPGGKIIYLKWQEWEAGLKAMVSGSRRIAIEYSPNGSNPYVAKVDAGTLELIKSFGVDVASSGDLIQFFEATWDEEQWQMHLEAAALNDQAYSVAWQFIADEVRSQGGVEETAVRDRIMQHYSDNNLTTYSPPIVARNAHSGMPHYETRDGDDTRIREGDFVLIDQWAKCNRPRSVYSDLTRTGYVGVSVPDQYTEIFNIVAAARDAAIDCVIAAFAAGKPLKGADVDDACRYVIEQAGYGEFFIHRTGHNIGQEVHGNGANMDHLETIEDRSVMPGTCFSVEPGIYLPEFGVRSEVNVFVDWSGGVHVTGGELQRQVVPILKQF